VPVCIESFEMSSLTQEQHNVICARVRQAAETLLKLFDEFVPGDYPDRDLIRATLQVGPYVPLDKLSEKLGPIGFLSEDYRMMNKYLLNSADRDLWTKTIHEVLDPLVDNLYDAWMGYVGLVTYAWKTNPVTPAGYEPPTEKDYEPLKKIGKFKDRVLFFHNSDRANFLKKLTPLLPTLPIQESLVSQLPDLDHPDGPKCAPQESSDEPSPSSDQQPVLDSTQ
jgi:hypothetical protein